MLGTPANLERCRVYLEPTVPSGQTNPQAAIEPAFRLRPDVLHLLTGDEFPDSRGAFKYVCKEDMGR